MHLLLLPRSGPLDIADGSPPQAAEERHLRQLCLLADILHHWAAHVAADVRSRLHVPDWRLHAAQRQRPAQPSGGGYRAGLPEGRMRADAL